MSTRKGQLSNSGIDRDWPHQVALPDDLCVGRNYEILDDFCSGRSISPRGRSVTAVWPGGRCELHRLYCFSDPADAQAFADAFGGILFDPQRDRARGRRHAWYRTDEYRRILDSGPLSVPDILRN